MKQTLINSTSFLYHKVGQKINFWKESLNLLNYIINLIL